MASSRDQDPLPGRMPWAPGWGRRRYFRELREYPGQSRDINAQAFDYPQVPRDFLEDYPAPEGETYAPRPGGRDYLAEYWDRVQGIGADLRVGDSRDISRALDAMAGPADLARFDREERAAARRRENEAVAAAVQDGEPVLQRGVVRDPHAPRGVPRQYKMQAYPIDQMISGMFEDQCFSLLDLISVGSGDDQRIGRKIRVRAFEYRLRCWNQNQQEVISQDAYSWAGVSGILPTTRTIPKVEVPADAWLTNYYDLVGLPAINLLAGAIAGTSVGPTITCAVNTELDTSLGPRDPIELQPQQTLVVNQPEFPYFPGYNVPAAYARKGIVGGEVTTVRILFFTDANPGSNYKTPGDTVPRAMDVFGYTVGFPAVYPTACGAYDRYNLTRFGIIHDTTWDPRGSANEVVCIRPAKMVEIPVVYPGVNPAVAETPTCNNIYFLPCTTDPWISGSTAQIRCQGFIRIFYEDE